METQMQYQCQCGHVNGGYDADNLEAMRRHQKSFDCPVYRDRFVSKALNGLLVVAIIGILVVAMGYYWSRAQ
jgi:hypothetical protein